MKRRNFMQMLGLAPVAAVVAPSVAEAAWVSAEDLAAGDGLIGASSFTEMVQSTIKIQMPYIFKSVTDNNALYSYLKSKDVIEVVDYGAELTVSGDEDYDEDYNPFDD